MDKRRIPAKPDIAAEHLRGQVEAKEFVEGTLAEVGVAVLNLTVTADPEAGLATQLLMGEGFTVYKEIPEMGLSWGQSLLDDYVGFVATQGLKPVEAGRRSVTAVAALIYETPALKSRVIGACSFGCKLAVEGEENGHHKVKDWGFIPSVYLEPLGGDFVEVATRFLNVPYLWGGRSSYGLDCSALVQMSLQAVGRTAPRDSDMQVVELGMAIEGHANLLRGDLVFWDGHVGIMQDAKTLLHANAHHMAVVSEPLDEAIYRIAAKENKLITAVRRL